MKRKTCIFKNFVMLFMAIGLFTVFIGCDDKNDEVGPLRQEVQALRADLTKEFDSKVNVKTKDLKDQLDQAKKEIANLSKRREGMSPEELQAKIDAATNDLITVTAAKTMYDKYVENVKAQLEGAATVAQLEALGKDIKGLDAKVNGFQSSIDDLSTQIGTINQKIALLETLAGGNKGDLDEALAKLKKDIKAEFGNRFNEITQSLDTEVQKLNQKIDSQKSDLIKMMEAYKKANAELIKANGELANANKGEIASLKTTIGQLRASITDLDTKLKNANAKLNLDVLSRILNSRLTSLTILPDYVSDNGGALPVVFFSSLDTNCGKLAPAVEVKYVVSPSTVTASDIDTRNLRFRYNDPKVASKSRQDEVAPKAEFVSLTNGILTVRASVNINETWAAKANPDNRIDQLMLEVPVSGKDVVVSSDWAKIKYNSMTAELVRAQKQVSSDPWSTYVLPSTAVAAEALPVNSPTVVEMAYNKPLDMNDVVKAMYSNWKDFDPSLYDLEFAYDLNDEKGNKIVFELGGNKTDQQEFIEIRGGHMLHTKVYTQNGNRAAIGRTPIVRVMLKKKGESCIAKQGFVKINIVEQAIPAVPPVVFPYQGTYTAKCGSPQELYRVDTKQMNEEFYHKVNMSKEDFHKNYTFANLSGGVGTIKEEQDPTDKTSYNLVYTLTEAEVWQNAGKEVEKKATYTYGNSVIEVTFKVTIVKPTVTLDVLLDNYWYNKSALVKDGVKNTIVQNVAVPADGDTNPNNATYSNNINNAFESVNNLLNVGSGYTYEYKFDNTPKSQPISGTTVSADGKKLMYGSEVIATIERTSEGDMLRYGTSDKAKELLNKGPQYSRAKVVLIVKNSCSKELNVVVKDLQEKDRFEVIFLRPINVEGVSTKHFIDGVDFGTTGSYIDIKEIAELSDWRNFVTKTDKYNFLPDHKNYYAYYGVKNIKVDIQNIKTEGLTVGGRAVTDVPGTVEIKQTPNNETVGTVTYQYGRLTYHNNGNNLGQEFWLVLPVTVEYKWGQIVNTTVKVKVDPTKNARKRVK